MERLPKKVEGYTIGESLGAGLTGVTHEATTTGRDGQLRPTVFKFCHPERSKLQEWAPRLKKEIDPRIVRYDLTGRSTRRWSGYYATDRLNSQPIEMVCRKLLIEERLTIAADIAEAIAVLHGLRQPLVHGYLKPSNVLLRFEEGRYYPVLTDLGVIPVYEAAFHDDPANAAALYPYLAPELIEAFRAGSSEPETFTPQADVYSAAAVLCFLLSGRAPGTAEWEATELPVEEILAGKLRGAYYLHALVDASAPVDLDRVNKALATALAPQADDRPSAQAFADELRSSVLTAQT